MATYAAFKHVELHKVGYGKNRVPNAPRGCIGEIFGGDGSGPANGKAGSSTVDSPSRPKDTHNRLFGGPSQRPSTAVRDTLRSNISFGEESRPQPPVANGGHATNGQANGHSTNGHANGHHVVTPPKEGNPVSGEGYKSMNGEINTVTALNGNGMQINHNRVPPGGYSSGLW